MLLSWSSFLLLSRHHCMFTYIFLSCFLWLPFSPFATSVTQWLFYCGVWAEGFLPDSNGEKALSLIRFFSQGVQDIRGPKACGFDLHTRQTLPLLCSVLCVSFWDRKVIPWMEIMGNQSWGLSRGEARISLDARVSQDVWALFKLRGQLTTWTPQVSPRRKEVGAWGGTFSDGGWDS